MQCLTILEINVRNLYYIYMDSVCFFFLQSFICWGRLFFKFNMMNVIVFLPLKDYTTSQAVIWDNCWTQNHSQNSAINSYTDCHRFLPGKWRWCGIFNMANKSVSALGLANVWCLRKAYSINLNLQPSFLPFF